MSLQTERGKPLTLFVNIYFKKIDVSITNVLGISKSHLWEDIRMLILDGKKSPFL